MRRRIRHAAKIALAALAVTTGMVILPAAPAQAADWDRSLQNEVRADQLFAHPDGKVTVAACGAPSGDTLQAKTFDTSGSFVYANEVANSTSPKLYACMGQSTIGKDGTLYASGYYSGQSYERLVAYKNNAQKWNVQLPNSCSTFHSIAMGVNGNIYMIGGSCSGSTYRLIGFTPEVATGQPTPSVVLNVAVDNYFGGNTGDSLAAHNNGLVVQLNNGLQFFGYSGNTSGVIQPANFAKGHDGALVANTNGRVFHPVVASSTDQTECGSSGGYIHSGIEGRSASGVEWQYSFTECEHVWFVRPTYDGGAVIDTWRTSEIATPLGRWITAVDGSGDVKWSVQVAQYNGTWSMSSHSITTTLNGDVLLASVLNERTNNPVNDNRVALNLISGATGQFIGHKLFEGTTHGYSFANSNDLVVLANGRVYTVLRQCIYTSCSGDQTLYAVDMAAATPSYPRGAVLANDEPWLEYVALGDSFSSGEGVPSFLNGTDTAGPPENRCHRSEKAYSRLLNGNAALRWNLVSFAACSGATTNYALEGWPSGTNTAVGAQIENLSSSTDVVTLTLGGNDIGFAEFVLKCLFLDCGDSAVNRPFFQKIENELAGNSASDPLPGTGLLGLYGAIQQKAPDAKVYVAGYPQILPSTACTQTGTLMGIFNEIVTHAHNEGINPGAWSGTLHAIGAAGGIPGSDVEALRATGVFEFNNSELSAARTLVLELNEEVKNLVEGLSDPNFKYVDTLGQGSPFNGHELCTTQPYFIGLDASNKEYSFHPNSAGQLAYAQLFSMNI